MDLMKVIQVGNGNVAKMHRDCFITRATVIAIVETDPAKRKLAETGGFTTFPDIASVPLELMEKVELWDICVPDESHLPAMRDILERDFKKILVEKPICQPSQIPAMEKLLEDFTDAKICVEETYASSQVVATIRDMCEKYHIFHPHIVMEQSKNRGQDIVNGRFIDKELGVFALEVPHSLSAIAGTGDKRGPAAIQEVLLEDMTLPSGEILPRQGKGRISYIAEDGCQVEICSAMNGDVFYPLPELNAPTTIPFGDPTRYRIMILREGKYKIIGQFEPIAGWPRYKGRVLVYKNESLENTVEVEDRPMNRHINRAISYFMEEGENPSPPSVALLLVIFLSKVLKRL